MLVLLKRASLTCRRLADDSDSRQLGVTEPSNGEGLEARFPSVDFYIKCVLTFSRY